MSAIQRPRTSYDQYGDQLKDDYFQDMSGYIPIQGRQTPIGMVRPSSPGGPRLNTGERQSRSRARSTRPGMGARSLTMHSMEYGPDHRQDENPYAMPMDPVNQQHYYRKWRNQPPQSQAPIYREGRLGSPWRHVKSCINNGGSHLVFIDGTVKTEENFFYPPEAMNGPPDFSQFVSPHMPRRSMSQVPMTYRDPRSNQFNERAKQGFVYWNKQKKPIDLAGRYRQKAKMLTLGASCSN